MVCILRVCEEGRVRVVLATSLGFSEKAISGEGRLEDSGGCK